MSPGAIADGGGGAETPTVCCVPPGCACGPPGGPCVVVAAWPQLGGQPHQDGQRGPLTPRGFQQGPLAGHAAPSAAHTPSAGSWEIRITNTAQIQSLEESLPRSTEAVPEACSCPTRQPFFKICHPSQDRSHLCS